MENLKIVIAVDSFKGSITSKEASESIEKGIKNFYKKNISLHKVAIADGGEGTVEAVVEGAGGEYEYLEVVGPLKKSLKARIGILKEGVAVLEMAESSGINLLKKEELNPFETTTYGVGEMIKKVLDRGIRKIYLGIGGSSTNDGGAGMLAALGVKYFNEEGEEIGYTPKELKNLFKVDISELDGRVKETEITLLSDVNNPLCGMKGASHIYGPQKGATEKDVLELDGILENYGKIVDGILGEKYMENPGAGAAGGLGYALMSVCNAKFKQGISEVMEIIKFESLLKDADLVITGEGRIDNQSIHGKAPVGIAKMAKKYGIPVIAIVGSSDRNLGKVYESGIDLVLDIINEPMNLERAIADVKELLEFTGEKAMRAFCLGKKQ